MSKKTVYYLLATLFIWRSGLFFIGSIADHFLPYHPTFPYADFLLATSNLPRWFYSWGNFDGVHYLTIAANGYFGIGLVQAFFPIYPISIALLSVLKVQPIWGGLLISNLALVGFAWSWLKLIRLEFNQKIAWLSLLILLLFPSSFFLGAIYSESLFLFFMIQAFYWSKQKQWWLAGLFTALATGTRLVGIFLVPALLMENWLINARALSLKNLGLWLKHEWFHLLQILTGTLGLLLYMGYLDVVFKDPLFFLHVQADFGAGRQASLVLWPQVVWRYCKILVTYQPHNWKFFAIVQELAMSLFSLVGLILAVKKIRWSYLVFAGGAYFLPTLTGNFSSMPRYILVCLPLWVWLALVLEKYRKWQIAWLLTSTFLLVLNTILFVQGYWVS